MSSSKVIVFGPTGAVGSAAAQTASELGAQVVLAMRDTSKSIPGLDADEEKQANYQRVWADLTKPDTVRDAVTSTGAKRAFIYFAHGASDYMKSSIEALKAAGIELVVFLSSFTVQGKLESVPPEEIISYFHAKVEIHLTNIFGAENYVALRPGSFASNTSQYKSGIKGGEVKMFTPDIKVDGISPEDIGRVGGTVLANGTPKDGNNRIYLYGPELLSQRTTVEIIAKVLGKSVKIGTADEEEALRQMLEERSVPEPVARYILEKEKKSKSQPSLMFGHDFDQADFGNIQKYTGKKPTTFEEWVSVNKDVFA
ncbi:MAG: hypothetical protein MMC23_004280 [Stictis urceolatum]|nr:hypothetical protein [Stictis urceolata]